MLINGLDQKLRMEKIMKCADCRTPIHNGLLCDQCAPRIEATIKLMGKGRPSQSLGEKPKRPQVTLPKVNFNAQAR